MRSAFLALFTCLMLVLGIACSHAGPDQKTAVSKSLQQAGFDKINLDWDRNKGVITLKGRVRSVDQKTQAGQVAQQAAPNLVIANQLSIEPVDEESRARKIEGNVDQSIEKDLKATLLANKLEKEHIRYHAVNGVVTLEGSVKSQEERREAQQLAASVPNVQQVVNKIDVK